MEIQLFGMMLFFSAVQLYFILKAIDDMEKKIDLIMEKFKIKEEEP